MNALLRGLELVEAGATDISSPSVEDEGYVDFQAMAEALVEAKDVKLLYEVAVQRSKGRATYGHAVRVLVAGGITPKGRQFLDCAQASVLEIPLSPKPQVEKEPEILQLRPAFAGMSIDLKALWKKWQSRARDA